MTNSRIYTYRTAYTIFTVIIKFRYVQSLSLKYSQYIITIYNQQTNNMIITWNHITSNYMNYSNFFIAVVFNNIVIRLYLITNKYILIYYTRLKTVCLLLKVGNTKYFNTETSDWYRVFSKGVPRPFYRREIHTTY